jgi:hypothetical protein
MTNGCIQLVFDILVGFDGVFALNFAPHRMQRNDRSHQPFDDLPANVKALMRRHSKTSWTTSKALWGLVWRKPNFERYREEYPTSGPFSIGHWKLFGEHIHGMLEMSACERYVTRIIFFLPLPEAYGLGFPYEQFAKDISRLRANPRVNAIDHAHAVDHIDTTD